MIRVLHMKRCMLLLQAVVCLALGLVPKANNPSHWWDLRIGSMPLAKVVCFPSMIVVVLIEHRFFHAINNKINSHCKTSICDRLGISRAKQVTQNRHYIRTLAEIILLCSHQEIALPGHREGKDSMNRGNFFRNTRHCCNS